MRPPRVVSLASRHRHQTYQAAANGSPLCPLGASVRCKLPHGATQQPHAMSAPGGERQRLSTKVASLAFCDEQERGPAAMCGSQDQPCSSSSSSSRSQAVGTASALQSRSRVWPRRRDLLASSGAAVLLNACNAAAPTAVWPHGASRAALVDEDVAVRVYEQAAPSVASIAIIRSAQGVESTEGVGSGVVWSSGGHVVTNYHCVARLDRASQFLRVTLVDATDGNGATREATYNATVIGTDSIHDLAVLQLEGLQGPTTPIPVATSSDLRVGQSVYAIGNPYGLSRTLSVGLVSGLDRSIPSPAGARIYGVIQTDATINAGNSGGPLLDSSGRLVGLNTATFTRSGTGRGSGVNFALPADMLRDIVPKLIVYGNALGKRV